MSHPSFGGRFGIRPIDYLQTSIIRHEWLIS
jgi:hypothetical protein